MELPLYTWKEIQEIKRLAIPEATAASFVQNAVIPSIPVVLRKPVEQELFTERDTLEVIRDIFQNPFRDLPHPKIILGDTELFSEHANDPDFIAERLMELLPEPDRESAQDYVERIKKKASCPELFYYMKVRANNNPLLWHKVREVQKHIFRHMPYPAGGVEIDIFFGDYSKTPTNIHRDGAGFIYVVSGKKTFVVWPYRHFSGLELVKKDAHLRPAYFLGESAKFSEHESSGITLEGNRGDIIFWPDDHWHIGKGDGSTAITFCMSFFFNAPVLPDLFPSLQEIGESDPARYVPRSLAPPTGIQWGDSGPNSLVSSLDHWWNEASILHSRLKDSYTLLQIERASGAGFNQPFFPTQIDRSAVRNLKVKCDPEYPILLLVRGQTVYVAANGVSRELPEGAGSVIRFVDWLNRGIPFTPGTAVQEFCKSQTSPLNASQVETLEQCLDFILSMRAAYLLDENEA